MTADSQKGKYVIEISGEELNKIYYICSIYINEYYKNPEHSTYKDAKEIMGKIGKLIWK